MAEPQLGKVIPLSPRDEEQAAEAAAATRTGATYGFFGLLLGAVVSSVGGLLGSRSVANRNDGTGPRRGAYAAH